MFAVMKLDENDIKQAIAKYYEVDLDCIELRGGTKTVGYGMNEHQIGCVNATITIFPKERG